MAGLMGPVKPEKPKLNFENTYRMHPDRQEKFTQGKAQHIIYDVLEEVLHKEKYDSTKSPKYAQEICGLLKSRMKNLNCPRYKFICHVMIGEDLKQGLHE